MNTFYTLVVLLLLCTPAALSQNLTIPDGNFKAALIDVGVDTDMDNEISKFEAEAVTNLNIASRNISDLTGIEHFTNLEGLGCDGNSLTTLDVSKITSLKALSCNYNSLTSLNVSGLTDLVVLSCRNNSLTSLNGKGLTSLEVLLCDSNSLMSLNVDGQHSLIVLSCVNNSLTSLDISGLNSLDVLLCESNFLKSIDIRNTPSLEVVVAENNPDLECIVVDDPMQVSPVIVTSQPVPYTKIPCVVSDFDDIKEIVESSGMPFFTTDIMTAAIQIAEESCAQGSSTAAIYQLYTLQLMVHRSRQIGRISTSMADELSESIDMLITNIRSGALDCTGHENKSILDRINDWFGYNLESSESVPTVLSPVKKSQFTQKVYPNPTSDRLQFSNGNQHVVIYDMLGKVVGKASGADFIDLSAYQPGVYAVQLGEGMDREVFQVIKE